LQRFFRTVFSWNMTIVLLDCFSACEYRGGTVVSPVLPRFERL
jgi:hypothetical protein